MNLIHKLIWIKWEIEYFNYLINVLEIKLNEISSKTDYRKTTSQIAENVLSFTNKYGLTCRFNVYLQVQSWNGVTCRCLNSTLGTINVTRVPPQMYFRRRQVGRMGSSADKSGNGVITSSIVNTVQPRTLPRWIDSLFMQIVPIRTIERYFEVFF